MPNFWPPCWHPNSCRHWVPLMGNNKEKATDWKKGQNNKRSSRRAVKKQNYSKQSSICIMLETILGLVFIRRKWIWEIKRHDANTPYVALWNKVSNPCRGLKSIFNRSYEARCYREKIRNWGRNAVGRKEGRMEGRKEQENELRFCWEQNLFREQSRCKELEEMAHQTELRLASFL